LGSNLDKLNLVDNGAKITDLVVLNKKSLMQAATGLIPENN